jgi:hypothetical protein
LKQLKSKLQANFSQGEVPAKEGGFIRGIGILVINISSEEKAKLRYGVSRQDLELTLLR